MSGEVARLEEILCTVGEQHWPWTQRLFSPFFQVGTFILWYLSPSCQRKLTQN